MAHADPHPSDAVAAGEVRSWLEDRRDDIVELTARLARAESPSADGAAQAGMRAILTEEFAAVGLTVESLPGRAGCDHLCAQDRSVDADGPSQLLLGHLDTVWPVGTLERMPVAIHDGRLHGPGVFDMKAGLAQMIYALRALRAVGHRPVCRPVVFVSADEEIGSQTSAEHIRRLARRVRRVLVLEPAFGPRGALKTARKGIGNFTLTVRGVASHAGLDPEGGVSAIRELSRQIEALFELNDHARGVTVNVGTIDGGLRPNVIAPVATAHIEARAPTTADAAALERAILGLRPTRERITLEVTGGFRRPPMEETPANRALWHTARAAAQALGMSVEQARVGGGSDGNLTSPLVATLDGLGAVGDGAHADHENVVIAALPERAALLAALLMMPPGGAT